MRQAASPGLGAHGSLLWAGATGTEFPKVQVRQSPSGERERDQALPSKDGKLGKTRQTRKYKSDKGAMIKDSPRVTFHSTWMTRLDVVS